MINKEDFNEIKKFQIIIDSQEHLDFVYKKIKEIGFFVNIDNFIKNYNNEKYIKRIILNNLSGSYSLTYSANINNSIREFEYPDISHKFKMEIKKHKRKKLNI